MRRGQKQKAWWNTRSQRNQIARSKLPGRIGKPIFKRTVWR